MLLVYTVTWLFLWIFDAVAFMMTRINPNSDQLAWGRHRSWRDAKKKKEASLLRCHLYDPSKNRKTSKNSRRYFRYSKLIILYLQHSDIFLIPVDTVNNCAYSGKGVCEFACVRWHRAPEN
ncbi:hypothetical protein QBC46DRAFT_391606 [Diplogelasinospora grovesii]|uniref:Secreted protein n=1 Tax=Diplogelasinospora grovesii TaxID=303347 RepID=A0AAN6N2C6_9PEZI|nr:hypothetical protein QBC46DRAFT_391606 [Diplogelasinospora grovesii]